MKLYSFHIAVFLFLSMLLVHNQDSFSEEYQPDVKGATNEGELALEGIQYPGYLKASLWAAEPMLANPVAFGIDEQGRMYVCETFRQKKGVEDNRGHMVWLEDDLSLTSVEERLEMFKKHLGDDVAAYGKEHDRIRLLEDTDHDGKADRSTVFADGFNNILDGTGAGVLALDGDVYYTCIPKLYKLEDSNGDGKVDQREALHHGYGVRVAFRGHDMHGLILGPDGRLYFSIGDRGYNVITKEGNHLVRPDTGAVFRCELDGSNLEVFAYGLRNPQELAFDDYGNLFTGDNNSDSGDQARWVYVAERSDTGWRMYFQYLQDRGPWNRERMWYPYRADEETTAFQPAYIVPPIINISDGPSGLVCYPGIGLDDEFSGRFFLADFRGASGQSGVRHFAVRPKGAGFEFIDHGWFIQNVLVTDVDFGYDGKLYLTDWVDGWDGPGKGRVYTFAHPGHAAAASDTAKIMAGGFKELSNEQLVKLCRHADRRIRTRAQLQLVNNSASSELLSLAKGPGDLLPRLHGVWGLGQLLRKEQIQVSQLASIIKDTNPVIRAQVLKVLSDARNEDAFGHLIRAIQTGTEREQYFAAIGLGHLQKEGSEQALVELLTRNNDEDPFLRHAGIMGLAGCLDSERLAQLKDVQYADAVRLAAVVALRRHESPFLNEYLNDPNPKIVVEAARAIHDLGIEEAMPALANLRVSNEAPDALIRRVMNANFRLGQPENAMAVAAMAANDHFSDVIRKEAMTQLLLWDQPPVLDRVINIHRPIESRDAALAKVAVQKHLGGMLAGSADLKTEAIKLAAKYEVRDISDYLLSIFQSAENSAEMREQALIALDAVQVSDLNRLLESATQDQSDQVRATGRKLLARRSPDKVIPLLAAAVNDGSRVERQSAVEVLATLDKPAADEVLLAALDQFLKGQLAPEIKLDVLQVAKKKESQNFREKLDKIEAKRKPADPLSQFEECLEGGSVTRGVEIFFGNAAASCRRCHKVKGDGSDVGPDLSAVAKENSREYLLESIINPNAKIAKGFETVVFAMDDGRILSGIIKGEDEKTFRVMKPMGEIVIIEKDQIDAQAKGQSGMPADMAKQLSKSDIRDLVEYLSTLKTPYKPEGHE